MTPQRLLWTGHGRPRPSAPKREVSSSKWHFYSQPLNSHDGVSEGCQRQTFKRSQGVKEIAKYRRGFCSFLSHALITSSAAAFHTQIKTLEIDGAVPLLFLRPPLFLSITMREASQMEIRLILTIHVCYSSGPGKFTQGLGETFPPKPGIQSAETLICVVTSMYSLELLH